MINLNAIHYPTVDPTLPSQQQQQQQEQRQLPTTTRFITDSVLKRKKIFSLFSNNEENQSIKKKNNGTLFNLTLNHSSSSTLSTLSTSSTLCSSPLSFSSSLPITTSHSTFTNNDDYQELKKLFTKFQNKNKQRSDILKFHLLPWFKHHPSFYQEKQNRTKIMEKELSQARSILLRWWRVLINQLQQVNYTERSLYFDSLVEIISRLEFIDYDQTSLNFDEWHATFKNKIMEKRSQLEDYRYLLMSTLKYAIEKLNHKAIYSNMISFCAKILALCLIKIPGLISSLLHILPIKNKMLKRLNTEMGDLSNQEYYKDKLYQLFPKHLQPWMTSDYKQYKQQFQNLKKSQKEPIETKGNWTRRWQSDDSELFFSFYRHYHVTLKVYIIHLFPSMNKLNLQQRNNILSIAPGYLYLASYFAGKMDALLHRQLHSVTTNMHPSSNNKQQQQPIMDSDDGILSIYINNNNNNSSSSSNSTQQQKQQQNISLPTGKPNALEVATRKYAECLVWCIMISESNGLYHDMINIWMKTVVKSTNMMNIESVYCLLDFIEAMILDIQKTKNKMYTKAKTPPSPSSTSSSSSTSNKDSSPPSRTTHTTPITTTNTTAKLIPKIEKSLPPLDIPFLLHTLYIILLKSDHSILLLRALSFIYTHFDFLTSHTALLDFLGHRILLHQEIFERLCLHWGKNVRLFFVRCLMWRLGRVWTDKKNINWSRLLPLSSSSPSNTGYGENRDDDEMNSSSSISSSICDGSYCQLVLDQKIQSFQDEWHQNSTSMNEESYNRCALEIHISLENKLKSFQSRYLKLNNQYTNQLSTTMKGIPITTLLKDPSNYHCNNNNNNDDDDDDEQSFQSHVEIITYPPDHFKEKITSPLSSSSQKSKATAIITTNNSSNHTLTSTSTTDSSPSSSSALFKKKNNIFTRTLLNRSSTTKDKWLKLLPFQQQSMNINNDNNNQYLQSQTSLSKIKEKINDEKTENNENKKTNKDYIHTYYYTIPCTYTPSSSINTTNTNMDSLKNQQQQNTPIIITDQVQPLKGKQKNKEFPRQDSSLYMDDDDDDDDDDEYQNNNNTSTATSPLSTSTPTTSISDQSILKDGDEENQHMLEDEEKKERNNQQRQKLYNRFQRLKLPWHYAITNHIYATQFMLDLPSVLDEYVNWETSLQQQHPHHSGHHDMAPLLALDWPKNWTCSQL